MTIPRLIAVTLLSVVLTLCALATGMEIGSRQTEAKLAKPRVIYPPNKVEVLDTFNCTEAARTAYQQCRMSRTKAKG